MRIPIKLNRAFWPKSLCRILPSADDPRVLLRPGIDSAAFTRAISVFKFGTTFKTTQKTRFPQTIAALAKLPFSVPPVILDVGASDGATSLDVMQALAFQTYFVTDLNTEVLWKTYGADMNARGANANNANRVEHSKSTEAARLPIVFYDPAGSPILLATNRWVVYNDPAGALPPLGALARRWFTQAPAVDSSAERILLINPSLQAAVGESIRVVRHNLFDTWPFEKANLVIAANILNKTYFNDALLGQAVRNLQAALSEHGYLAIVDSRETEKATIFERSGRIFGQINGGTEIEALSAANLSKLA